MKLVHRLASALLLAACGGAFAAGAADAVSVDDAYVRLMPPGATTAAFMTLKNTGDKPVKLVKAASAAAKTLELHNHINDGGVMKMRQVAAIEVAAKGETALKPGSYHIMLIGPRAMTEGEKVTLKLGFDDGSSKDVEAVVKKPEAAPMPMPMNHDHMHMQH